MLVRCIYASRAAVGADQNVLDDILGQSRNKNQKLGITGLLIYANGIFLQVLEGGRATVSQLLDTIMHDPRHGQLQILTWEEIDERKFGGWSMGQVNTASLNPGLLLKYAETPDLDPFQMSGSATMALLLEIAASGAIIQRCG